MANSYTRTLVETMAAMSLIPKPAGVLATQPGSLSELRYFGNQRWPRMARLNMRQRDTIDRAGMDAEPNNPARILIHGHQDPVGPQPYRLAPEQIHTPETVFHVAQESQPGGTTAVLSREVVMAENLSNHVFVDLDVERPGDLLGDSRAAPVGILLREAAGVLGKRRYWMA